MGAPSRYTVLWIARGPLPSRAIVLHRGALAIGRDPRLPICLNDPEVSRRHALLVHGPRGTFLHDAGSRNGIHVNGVRLRPGEGRRILPGDVILLGWTSLTIRRQAHRPPHATYIPRVRDEETAPMAGTRTRRQEHRAQRRTG